MPYELNLWPQEVMDFVFELARHPDIAKAVQDLGIANPMEENRMDEVYGFVASSFGIVLDDWYEHADIASMLTKRLYERRTGVGLILNS